MILSLSSLTNVIKSSILHPSLSNLQKIIVSLDLAISIALSKLGLLLFEPLTSFFCEHRFFVEFLNTQIYIILTYFDIERECIENGYFQYTPFLYDTSY